MSIEVFSKIMPKAVSLAYLNAQSAPVQKIDPDWHSPFRVNLRVFVFSTI